jgi:hypothetical protein
VRDAPPRPQTTPVALAHDPWFAAAGVGVPGRLGAGRQGADAERAQAAVDLDREAAALAHAEPRSGPCRARSSGGSRMRSPPWCDAPRRLRGRGKKTGGALLTGGAAGTTPGRRRKGTGAPAAHGGLG